LRRDLGTVGIVVVVTVAVATVAFVHDALTALPPVVVALFLPKLSKVFERIGCFRARVEVLPQLDLMMITMRAGEVVAVNLVNLVDGG
jgi:hypothetical protein